MEHWWAYTEAGVGICYNEGLRKTRSESRDSSGEPFGWIVPVVVIPQDPDNPHLIVTDTDSEGVYIYATAGGELVERTP